MQPTPPPVPVADAFCRAYRAGLAWSSVLSVAGVHRSTWARMQAGNGYRSTTLDSIEAAIDRLLAPDPADAPAITTTQEIPQHGG